MVTTQTVTCTGSSLLITCEVEHSGRVKVSAFDGSGEEVSSEVLTQTGTRIAAGKLSNSRDLPVTLRFEIDHAKVYSFGFSDPP